MSPIWNIPAPDAKPLKGILAHIFRDSSGNDYSNGEISATVTSVVVVGPGIDEVMTATEETPAVRLAARDWLGEVSYHAEPVTETTGHWWCHGGTYIHTSDSRFRAAVNHNGAVPLHDRAE